MYCDNCGKKLEEDGRICEECQMLASNSKITKEYVIERIKKSEEKKSFAFAMGSIIVVMLCVLLLMIISAAINSSDPASGSIEGALYAVVLIYSPAFVVVSVLFLKTICSYRKDYSVAISEINRDIEGKNISKETMELIQKETQKERKFSIISKVIIVFSSIFLIIALVLIAGFIKLIFFY